MLRSYAENGSTSQCLSDTSPAAFQEDACQDPPLSHDNRTTSETFDNPIYDQPSPQKKSGGSLTESRLCSSMPSSGSVSVSSSQNYSPLCSRALEHSLKSDLNSHFYESEESLNTFWKRINGTSPQHVSRSNIFEGEKLTVINESYDSLPCSGTNSSEFLQESTLQASACATNYTMANSRRLAGRPIISEVASSEVLNKGRAGYEPNTQELRKCHDKYHANSCDMEIEVETSEQ